MPGGIAPPRAMTTKKFQCLCVGFPTGLSALHPTVKARRHRVSACAKHWEYYARRSGCSGAPCACESDSRFAFFTHLDTVACNLRTAGADFVERIDSTFLLCSLSGLSHRPEGSAVQADFRIPKTGLHSAGQAAWASWHIMRDLCLGTPQGALASLADPVASWICQTDGQSPVGVLGLFA